jgi:hypothetical protein
MTTKHSYNTIIDALLNNNDVEYYLTYIKENEFQDDELIGLKAFLSNHNNDLTLLKEFLNPPKLIPSNLNSGSVPLFYKIAAGIALLIIGGVLAKFLFFSSSSLDHYLIEDTGFKVYMSAETNKNMHLSNGMSEYRIGNYNNAIREFKLVTGNDTANYYLGICFLKTNELDSASIFLESIKPNSLYYNKSQYYLALSYLYNHKTALGLTILRKNNFQEKEFENNKKLLLNENE